MFSNEEVLWLGCCVDLTCGSIDMVFMLFNIACIVFQTILRRRCVVFWFFFFPQFMLIGVETDIWIVLRLTCSLAPVRVKMLVGSKSSPVSHSSPLCAHKTEFPQSSSGGILGVIQVIVGQVCGHGNRSTSSL